MSCWAFPPFLSIVSWLLLCLVVTRRFWLKTWRVNVCKRVWERATARGFWLKTWRVDVWKRVECVQWNFSVQCTWNEFHVLKGRRDFRTHWSTCASDREDNLCFLAFQLFHDTPWRPGSISLRVIFEARQTAGTQTWKCLRQNACAHSQCETHTRTCKFAEDRETRNQDN